MLEVGNVIFLVYDKTLLSNDSKPKGGINLADMQTVQTSENSREFMLKIEKREFKLRAQSLEEKMKWITALEFLRDYA